MVLRNETSIFPNLPEGSVIALDTETSRPVGILTTGVPCLSSLWPG
jgi:hypothetical protein